MRNIIFLFLLLAGCATVSSEVSLKKIRPTDRVYAGRIKIKMNENESPKCEIYLNHDITPSVKLASDGFIAYKTDRDKLNFRKIACYHQYSQRMGAWHLQKLNLSPVVKSDSNENAVYFGDIELDWKIDPELSKEAADKSRESLAHIKEGRVEDSGDLKVTVVDRFAEMQVDFFNRIPLAKEKGLKLQSSIMVNAK